VEDSVTHKERAAWFVQEGEVAGTMTWGMNGPECPDGLAVADCPVGVTGCQ
jgi:hypothetical protein